VLWFLVALAHPAQSAIITMQIAGPSQGLSNPDQAIFTSHDQKVVENANGIFCTFNGIILDRSTNGGQTFVEVYNLGATNTTKAPTIESDENNNIYLIYPNPFGSATRFQKFTSANGYASPVVDKTFSQATSSSKYSSFYDQGRQRLYHATQHGYLFTFDTSGNLIRGQQLFNGGSVAAPSYPHLFVDDSGVIHYAMTMVDANAYVPYIGIRYLKAIDGGASWLTMSNTPVSVPTTSDPSGPATTINLPGEEAYQIWLANMHVKNGKVHFFYRMETNLWNYAGAGSPPLIPERQHYMRFDAATGVREIDSWSNFAGGSWKGDTLTVNAVYGCFASDPSDAHSPLYAMFCGSSTIAAIVSYDNGSTWHDAAQSPNEATVADVGCARHSPKNGHVIGTFSGAPSPWGWATPLFYQFSTVSPATNVWDGGGADGSWGTANNWDSNAVPVFDSGLDIIFNALGAGNLTNCLGANRTIRSLIFNSNADSDVGIYLAEKIASPITNCFLTFDGFLASATNTVQSGASGNFTIGVGGAGGLGSITLADNLVINHNGSGTLTFDRPINESGTGKGITKNGPGTLVLRQNNAYTGTTTVNAGTLLDGGTTNGCGTGPLVLGNGITFASDTNGSRALPNNVTLAGNLTLGQLTGGTGALTFTGSCDLGAATRTLTINNATTISGVVSNGGLSKTGSGSLTLSGTNTYTGQTTVFTGIVQLGDGGGTGSLDPTSVIAIGPSGKFQYNRTNNLNPFANNLVGTGTLVKTNTGELGLTGTNSFSGTLDVQQGKLSLSGSACVNGSPNVNVAGNGILSVGSGFLGGIATIGNLTGAGQIDPIYGQGTAVRTLQVSQSSDAIFSGVMADGTSGRVLAFTKNGAATLTLSGTNTYTGGTAISNGTLLVNGVMGNSAVTVSGGTLGGTGTLGGAVSVQPGGALSPGTSLGTLTINNSLVLAGTTFVEVNASNGQRDFVQGVTSITYGGSLVVTNLSGTLTNGQTFQLFSVSGTKTGSFTSITPALTGGQAWSFNPTNGVLSVVTTPANYPTNLSFSVSNGTLSLTWPVTHLGWVAQSNSSGLASPGNWFDIPASSNATSLNVSPDSTRTNVFYRLRAP